MGFLALLASRLRADKKRYLETLDHLEHAATQAGAITGAPGALNQDLDRCRATESFRRKAGELLHEAYSSSMWERFRARLRRLDAAWSDVEDAVTTVPPDPQKIREARETIVGHYRDLKSFVKEQSRFRLSLIVLGPLPPESSK